MKYKTVEDELETVETGTFREACEREILSLITRPLRKKYKKKIVIQWPCENYFDKNVNFTAAQIFIETHKTHLNKGKAYWRKQDVNIDLDFINDNLRIVTYQSIPYSNTNDILIYRRRNMYYQVEEIPMANPHGHEEAIKYISKIIDKKLSETKT